MSKMIYALMSIILLEATLYFFGGDYSNTSLFNVIIDPSSITISNDWYLVLKVALTAVAAAFIIPGTFFQFNIYFLYSGVSLVALSFLFVIVNFANALNGSLAALDPVISQLVMVFVIGPLFIFYTLAILEWVRSS